MFGGTKTLSVNKITSKNKRMTLPLRISYQQGAWHVTIQLTWVSPIKISRNLLICRVIWFKTPSSPLGALECQECSTIPSSPQKIDIVQDVTRRWRHSITHSDLHDIVQDVTQDLATFYNSFRFASRYSSRCDPKIWRHSITHSDLLPDIVQDVTQDLVTFYNSFRFSSRYSSRCDPEMATFSNLFLINTCSNHKILAIPSQRAFQNLIPLRVKIQNPQRS